MGTWIVLIILVILEVITAIEIAKESKRLKEMNPISFAIIWVNLLVVVFAAVIRLVGFSIF